ncbi:MAG: KpsF/GutQ family sugar-phosphate isomerase [Pseudomonadota bacterium]
MINKTISSDQELARESLITQATALQTVADNLGTEFDQAINLILECKGRVVLCGMGKSGLVGHKIAATFASTGTTSFFMHPAEAFHGDLGMLTEQDLLILISYSGETEEVIKLIPSLMFSKNKIISILGESNSTLAKHSNVVLNVAVEREVCPNNLAPTTSTLTTMAMGDALAVVLIKRRNFKPADFARFHPGGSLGKQLLTQVKDVMHHRDLPIVEEFSYLNDGILLMTEGRLGLVVVVNGKQQVKGIITDGDLRRTIEKNKQFDQLKVEDVMTKKPIIIQQEMMLSEAENLMMDNKIKALIVINEKKQINGIIEIFDR